MSHFPTVAAAAALSLKDLVFLLCSNSKHIVVIVVVVVVIVIDIFKLRYIHVVVVVVIVAFLLQNKYISFLYCFA